MKNEVNQEFKETGIRATALQLVARRVATRLFQGHLTADTGQDVVTRWRRCLSRLWHLPPEDRPKMFERSGLFLTCWNCRPAGYDIITRTFCCKQETVCPWCQAREAQRVFKMAMRVIRDMEPQYRREHGLFCFHYRTLCHEPRAGNVDKFFHSLVLARKKLYRNLSASALYFSDRIVPTKNRCWMIHSGGVALLGKGSVEEPQLLLPDKNWHRGVSLQRISAFPVANRLSVALVYPPRLLSAEPLDLAFLLNLRREHHHRLSASYGLFRGVLDDRETEEENNSGRPPQEIETKEGNTNGTTSGC